MTADNTQRRQTREAEKTKFRVKTTAHIKATTVAVEPIAFQGGNLYNSQLRCVLGVIELPFNKLMFIQLNESRQFVTFYKASLKHTKALA